MGDVVDLTAGGKVPTIRQLRGREIRKAAAVLRRSAKRLRDAGDGEGELALARSATFLEGVARQVEEEEVA